MKLLKAENGHGHLLIILAVAVAIISAVGFGVYKSQSSADLRQAQNTLLAIGPDGGNTSPNRPPSSTPKPPKKKGAPNSCASRWTAACTTAAAESAAADTSNANYNNWRNGTLQPGRCAERPSGGCYQAMKPKDQKKAKKAAKKRKAAVVRSVADKEPDETPANAPDDSPSLDNRSATDLPAAPTEKPEGNIVILTRVLEDNKKKRIGSVKVKIEREGDNAKCDNKKKLSGKTNSRAVTNGAKTKGSIHFIGCATGAYTVSVEGRKGYRIVGADTKKINLTEEETQVVKFTLEKN